jgi:hypothetical protein
MSVNLANPSHIDFSVGNAANVPNGAFSFLSLWRPTSNFTSLLTFWTGGVGGTIRRAYLLDTGHVFGDGDFSSGFGTVSPVSDWWWIGFSKPAGAAHYRGHLKNYSAGGAWSHGEAVGAGNHSDPGTANAISVGTGVTAIANGDVAVTAAWTSELADVAGFEAAATAALVDLMTASPAWAVSYQSGYTGAPLQDLTGGGGNESARTGTITDVADPPGYNFALTSPGLGRFLPFFGR